MMQETRLLMIFVKNPVAGLVKTRLAESIGDEQAKKVYEKLLSHTRSAAGTIQADRQVWYAGEIAERDAWSDYVFDKKLQAGGDLGERLEAAFRSGFREGYKKIVVIGSDCLQIRTRHLEAAFQRLDETDVVIGPAADGGYYLLGMNGWHSELFAGKTWSSPELYRQTLESLELKGLEFSELEVLNDIDTIDDLRESGLDLNSSDIQSGRNEF